MKPPKEQVDELYDFLRSLHGAERLEVLEAEAKKFLEYLESLDGFEFWETKPPREHVGRVIVDGVLQVGKDYENAVREAVRRILEFPAAATVSGFIRLLKERELIELINFKTEGTKKDLLVVAEFFANKKIDTFENLREWLKPEENRDSLMTDKSGLSGPVFRIADKGADYFRKLVGHWDAVAVDSNTKALLAEAGVISRYSRKYTYKEKRTIVQLTALLRPTRPIDLDSIIYNYSVRSKSSVQPSGRTKYCIRCGRKIARSANYCPECGTRQGGN